MNMKSTKGMINALSHYLYAAAYHMIPNRMNDNIVLFPFFGRLGDMIMFLDTLQEWKRILIEKQGKKVIFACRSEVWKLLESIGYTRNLVFMELTRESLDTISYFKQKVKESRAFHVDEIINVRENSVIENLYIYTIPAKRKTIYRSFEIHYSNSLARSISFITYTDDWKPDRDMDQISCYADMIRRYGNASFKSQISELPSFENKILPEHERYVCVGPGASSETKRWPAERYANVVDYVIDQTGMDAVFIGGKGDVQSSSAIVSLMRNKEKVVDLTGKTSLCEWISVIQHSVFVLTNESGSVHIAASSHVPSICIGEQKFSDKWLPYRPEILRDNDKIPIVVRGERLDCSFCVKTGFKRSTECEKCFREHGIVKCVYDVKEDDVKRAVDQVIQTL